MSSDDLPICLVYLPFTYAGSGVPQTAASLLPGIAAAGLDVRVHVPRVRQPLPDEVTTVQTLPLPLRYGRWRHVARAALWTLDRSFSKAIDQLAGRPAVAYFWPSYLGAPSVELIRHARAAGVPTVRQMVNTACATSRVILDELHARHHGGPHNITDELVAHEADELPAHDYILAPASEVGRSLEGMEIGAEHIVASSFGWSGVRFPDGRRTRGADPTVWPDTSGVRVLFVGIVGFRKGVPELLEAWRRASVKGQLVLVGQLDDTIRPAIEEAAERPDVHYLPFTDELSDLYRTADLFVFPTHEEGAPLVVYEAAAHGLPIVTTPMGTARLVDDGVNGVVVPAGDVAALAEAIATLAASPDRRSALGAAAAETAVRFEYDAVGRRHGAFLRRLALGEPVDLDAHPVA